MRLLVSDEWFDPISSEGQYESDYEGIVLGRGSLLFPNFHLVSFRMPVESEDGRKIPDMALVDRGYRSWWVVEVEMAHHSLYGHVMPQVEVFARGRYGEEHANYIADRHGGLNRESLVDMVRGAQPRVLVMVNRNVPDWFEPVHRLEGIITVVEVFRSGRNQHILRINGDYPETADTRVASSCRLDSTLPGLLQIDSPASLGIVAGQDIEIEFNGGLTSWSRLDASDNVWLVPRGRNPLNAKQEYMIQKDSDDRLSLTIRP